MKRTEHGRGHDFRSLREIADGLVMQPANSEESKAMDEAFSFNIPDKGGEVPTGEEKVEKKVRKQVKGTRSKIVNTVGIVVLSGLSFLAADNLRAQSAPPSSQPVATSSTEAGQKQEKIDPWHIVTLADGSQTKIVQMKDGRYILGVIMPNGKKLKGELETKDPQEAEKISIAYIKSYNARVIAEKELSQQEKELAEAQRRLDVAMEKLRNSGNVMADKAAAAAYNQAGQKKPDVK